jgi:hypothetical protein
VEAVPVAGHDEPDIRKLLQNLFGRIEEVLGPFLHRDPADEQHVPVAGGGPRRSGRGSTPCGGVHAVVDDLDLLRRNGVAGDDDVAGIIADRDHPRGRVHALTLDVVDKLVPVFAVRSNSVEWT